MLTDPSCVFCKIVSGELPCFKIAEDEKFLAFLDIAQFVEGHTLVIPKEHCEFTWDVSNFGEYYEFVKLVGSHYRNIGFKFVDTLTLGRMVHHAHVHLLPHNDDDETWNKVQAVLDGIQVEKERKPSQEKLQEIQGVFQML